MSMKERIGREGAAGETKNEEKTNVAVVAVGFSFAAAAFLTVLVPALMMLIPGASAGQSVPLARSCIYTSIAALVLSFTGIIMCAAGAKANKVLGQLGSAFGLLAFMFGTAVLVLGVLGTLAGGFGNLFPF